MKTNVERVYTGKKVRFSVKGKTMGIDARPLAAINVLAIKDDVVVEKTKSDDNGYYRIRGLMPN